MSCAKFWGEYCVRGENGRFIRLCYLVKEMPLVSPSVVSLVLL